MQRNEPGPAGMPRNRIAEAFAGSSRIERGLFQRGNRLNIGVR
jgi:hypothetical protein